MGGKSIYQARESLKIALDHLNPRDQFNIIQFNSVTSALFQQSVSASTANIAEAKQYVSQLTATGGTEMAPALSMALDSPSSSEHIRQVIFITDGSVGNEAALFKLINQKLDNARLFTVGIGSAPNGFFMRKAAQFGRGTYTYIGNNSDIEIKMLQLILKLESPIVSNLQLSWPGFESPEVFPKMLPDLYAGEPVIITAKWLNKMPQGDLTLSGTIANQSWKRHLSLDAMHQDSGIATLWARSKVELLMDEKYMGAEADEIRDRIIPLALSHNLITKYTSMIAVDQSLSRPDKAPLKNHAIANALPHGSTQTIGYPQGATWGPFHLIFGALTLLLTTLLYRYQKLSPIREA